MFVTAHLMLVSIAVLVVLIMLVLAAHFRIQALGMANAPTWMLRTRLGAAGLLATLAGLYVFVTGVGKTFDRSAGAGVICGFFGIALLGMAASMPREQLQRVSATRDKRSVQQDQAIRARDAAPERQSTTQPIASANAVPAAGRDEMRDLFAAMPWWNWVLIVLAAILATAVALHYVGAPLSYVLVALAVLLVCPSMGFAMRYAVSMSKNIDSKKSDASS